MPLQAINKTFYKVADFISWQKAKNLRLAPQFQRRSVWKPGAKSFLIDTIVRGYPIPIIFIRDRRVNPDNFEPIREIVDGQQRLRTLISYVAPDLLEDYNPNRDHFFVKRNHNKELAGKDFSELTFEDKSAILNYEFSVHVLPSSMDDREIIQVFRRMNSTNYSLNKQELRNAHYYGEFKSAVYLLAEEQLQRWRTWKTFTDDDISRMIEVEHTAECIILIINGEISGKSSAKLDYAFREYDETFSGREEVEKRFRHVMDVIDNHFAAEMPGFIFFKKTLIYTFFAFMYEILFGLDQPTNKVLKLKQLTTDEVSKIKQVNERIRERAAPTPVLEATDRRTTNPKERKNLYEYLLKNVRHVKENK